MKNLYLFLIVFALVISSCKKKSTSTENVPISKKEMASTIKGNFVQVLSQNPVGEYVEVFINDTTFYTYNKNWGFFDTQNFNYRIEGDIIHFYNRKPGTGDKAKLLTFLPDSFKIDYGFQIVNYFRIKDDKLWQNYNELSLAEFSSAYEDRRVKWMNSRRKKR
jgi:hypothetical protein